MSEKEGETTSDIIGEEGMFLKERALPVSFFTGGEKARDEVCPLLWGDLPKYVELEAGLNKIKSSDLIAKLLCKHYRVDESKAGTMIIYTDGSRAYENPPEGSKAVVIIGRLAECIRKEADASNMNACDLFRKILTDYFSTSGYDIYGGGNE